MCFFFRPSSAGGCFPQKRPTTVRHCHPPCTKPFSHCTPVRFKLTVCVPYESHAAVLRRSGSKRTAHLQISVAVTCQDSSPASERAMISSVTSSLCKLLTRRHFHAPENDKKRRKYPRRSVFYLVCVRDLR